MVAVVKVEITRLHLVQLVLRVALVFQQVVVVVQQQVALQAVQRLVQVVVD
jgi:hypothetical protein